MDLSRIGTQWLIFLPSHPPLPREEIQARKPGRPRCRAHGWCASGHMRAYRVLLVHAPASHISCPDVLAPLSLSPTVSYSTISTITSVERTTAQCGALMITQLQCITFSGREGRWGTARGLNRQPNTDTSRSQTGY